MARGNVKRTARVASLLREVLTEVLRRVKDPRVAGVSITDVEVTGDLRDAKVFIACFEDVAAGEAQLKGLAAASQFIRREVGQRIRLRSTPSLTFHLDTSLTYGARIESLLHSIRAADAANQKSDNDDDEH